MAIQYKRIIKQIMGPDAAARGFVAGKLGPAGITKMTLARYEKEYDEHYSLGFHIELDTVFDKLELWSCGIKEERSFDINDAESFRQVISEFAEIMRERGYRLMDEAAAKPRFTFSENIHLMDEYEQLAEEFCKENQVDNDMPFMDRLCLIKEMVEASRESSFDEVRQKLIKIAAFYAVALLGCDKVNSYLAHNMGLYLTVSGAWRGTIRPLQSIFDLWLNETDRNIIKDDCKSVLQPEQYDSLDWKF